MTLDWSVDDTNQFGNAEGELLNEIAPKHGVSPQMLKKLIDLETSMSGLVRRSGIFSKIGKLIQQDWESANDIIANNLELRQSQMRQSNHVKQLEQELKLINTLLEKEGIK